MVRPLSRVLIRYARLCLIQACTAAWLIAPVQAAEQTIREEQSLTIDGAKETWRLVWDGKPATVCGPDEVDIAVTCPCSGWAYAEFGSLSIVRHRSGHEDERMDLRPLFGQFDDPEDKAKDSAYLQRWPLEDNDLQRADRGDPTLTAEIEHRPVTKAMTFADYGHDGSRAFLLQVGTLPCGKHQFAAIGVTKADPLLHALTSAAHPGTPLIMPMAAWQALLQRPLPAEIETWACGDHSAVTRTTLAISAKDGVIRVKNREYSCPDDGGSGKLLNETDE